MNDERLRDAYERGLPPGADRRPLDDVEAEQLRRLVERAGSDEERLHTLDNLLSTAEGRRELEIVWSAARAARPRTGRRIWWQAAAALVLLVGAGTVWRTMRVAPPDGPRDPGSAFELVAPRGRVTDQEARRLTWRRVPELERYTVVVVDSAGNGLFTTETRDTTVRLPATVPLAAGRQFLWWVAGRTALGEERIATPIRVTVRSR